MARKNLDYRDEDLRGKRFRGRDLRGYDFRDVDFFASDLRDCDLRKAKMAGCKAEGANFSGANFSGTDLFASDFRWANLENTGLRYLDLDHRRAIAQPSEEGWVFYAGCFKGTGEELIERATAEGKTHYVDWVKEVMKTPCKSAPD